MTTVGKEPLKKKKRQNFHRKGIENQTAIYLNQKFQLQKKVIMDANDFREKLMFGSTRKIVSLRTVKKY